jgi:SAM-dependent methyltransferase
MTADIFVTVHLTLNQDNIKNVEEVLERLAKLEMKSLSLTSSDASSSDSYDDLRDKAAALGLTLKFDLPVPYSVSNPVVYEARENTIPEGAGKAWLYVEPDGDVFPRRVTRENAGNLLRDDWRRFIHRIASLMRGMDWHRRYLQQAQWTRDLRSYLFQKAGLNAASLVLEVGCGKARSSPNYRVMLHGLDIDSHVLLSGHAPAASLVRGNALRLPYASETFDIAYCHFLLLWVDDPLQALLEMKRVVKPGASVIAFAEPDYSARRDEPRELAPLGKWQSASLKRQGADPGLGARLADLFFRAGIEIVETGTIQNADHDPSPEAWETEWAVIESDLAGFIPGDELHKMKRLDQQARVRGERVLHVPTYFAWGRDQRNLNTHHTIPEAI